MLTLGSDRSAVDITTGSRPPPEPLPVRGDHLADDIAEAVSLIVQEIRSLLDGVPEPALPSVMEGLSERFGVTAEQLLSAYRQLRTIETGGTALTERQARMEECTALSEDREDPVVGGLVEWKDREDMEFERLVLGIGTGASGERVEGR